MRSNYVAFCLPNGKRVWNGFGHLNGAAAELIVEGVRNVESVSRPNAVADQNDATEQPCTQPDHVSLCKKADSLAWAAAIGCVEQVREFLTKNGIDSKNGRESMALRAAIHSGNESIVKLLLNAGAPPDPLEAMRSPLAEAVLSRQIGIMKLLLASGAQIDSLDHHSVAFLVESGVFDPQVLGVLLDAGANVDARDPEGETVLMKVSEAIAGDQSIKVLIEHKADVNLKDNRGRTALMHAAGECVSDAIPLLLENGADPNVRDEDGKSALDLADESNNLTAIAILSLATKRSR
jgi:ankyrin repeat protein